jgi:hypothetical protein
VLWGDLEGYTELQHFWHYVKPLAFQIRIYGVDKNTTNAIPTVTAFYPTNYMVDLGTPSGLYTDSAISSLAGAVTF